MSVGIVDTTVIFHYYRNITQARQWVDNQTVRLSVTPLTWLEVMRGASNKSIQSVSRAILGKFELIYLTPQDQQWAMQQLEAFHFSHRIGMNDCLIGSVANRLQIPLYTHNLKHMTPLLGNLAVKPY